jgi:asparagine synthase (glutamine-hydrolysing)
MIAALYKTIEVQDAPFSSFSIVAQYMLYNKVRSSGVKVLLGGQGGDEAFMGYKKFILFWLQQSMKQKNYFITAKNFMQTIPMIFSEITALKQYWQHRHRYLSGNQPSQNVLRLPEPGAMTLTNSRQELWRRQMQDISQFSLPTLLRYEDRNAMGNSVESRLPYMDHSLIELGLALPESIKLRAGYGKWALRKIMQNKIPDQIRLARYKRGFDIPLAPLLKSGLGQSIRSSMQTNRAVINEFLLQPGSVNELFSDQQLAQRKNAMSEAISLLWLNKVFS